MKGFKSNVGGRVGRWLLVVPMLLAVQAHGILDAPTLICASVEPNGDVTLTWDVPPDPNGEFDRYEVFHSSVIGGPYTLLTSINNYAVNTYLHVGAAGDVSQQFYYVNAVSNTMAPNVSPNSDTLGTLYLTLNQSTPLGSALLDWTLQHDPPIAGTTEFFVQMEYPLVTWTTIGQIPADSSFYEEVITVCEDTLAFRILLTNSFGCSSFSNLVGDEFADVTPPSSPDLIATTIDTVTGLVQLVWGVVPEPDTDGYIVVQVTPSGGVVVDTIYGVLDTTYTHLFSLPAEFSHSYTVASFDTCWTGMPPSPNTSATLPGHSTVHLQADYDRCNEVMHLDWTPYVGWDTLVGYEIYRKQNGNTPQLISSLPPGTGSFSDAFVLPFNTYCYFVKAIGSETGETSLSNFACRITDYPPLPLFNYLQVATVTGSDHVTIIDYVDTNAAVSSYRLERAQNDGPWTFLASKPPPIGTSVLRFDDLEASTGSISNRYRVQVIDSCGNPSITSNIGTSILLRVTADLTGVNYVDWNGYNDWNGQVQGYTLYRQPSGGVFTQLAVLGPSQWSYADDVSDEVAGDGKFCYLVEAFETGNLFGLDTISVSNIQCAVQEPQFWVPNAFMQDGINNTFGPVTGNVSFANYEFGVINRWGQVIWTTNDPNEKWDGKVNNKYVPQGVYGYYFTYLTGEGRQSEARGTVTFVR